MDVGRLSHLVATLTIGLTALLISTTIIGKVQLGQATPFHFISALVLGELLGNAVYDQEVSISYILFSIALWTTLMYIIEKITQKFRSSRGFFEGKPSIIIRDGNIDIDELKKNNMDINELQRLLRDKDVFSIRQVEYGILEPGGTISVLRKWQYTSPTNKDLNIPQNSVFLPIALVSDGQIIKENLVTLGYDEKWLLDQIKMHNINDIKDVFFADWQQDEGLHVIPIKKAAELLR